MFQYKKQIRKIYIQTFKQIKHNKQLVIKQLQQYIVIKVLIKRFDRIVDLSYFGIFFFLLSLLNQERSLSLKSRYFMASLYIYIINITTFVFRGNIKFMNNFNGEKLISLKWNCG